jgi:hypothetical protein
LGEAATAAFEGATVGNVLKPNRIRKEKKV